MRIKQFLKETIGEFDEIPISRLMLASFISGFIITGIVVVLIEIEVI